MFTYLGAIVHAQTATGDTALTYACENGHTDVADVLLANGADLVSFFPLIQSRRTMFVASQQFVVFMNV